MSKGWGEQIQVISFASEVENFIPEGSENPVISTVGEMKQEGIEAIVDYVAKKCSEGSGMTFLSGAIKSAYESIEAFDLRESGGKNPTMIVCLTDGTPNKGNGVGLNPVPVVKEYAAKYPESVLYTIGLGEADNHLLKTLAGLGRGNFFAANDLGELWLYYDNLAKSFQMAIKTTGEE